MPTPSTVAIIGCGRWGSTVARKIDSLQPFRVTHVYDPSPGAATALLCDLDDAKYATSIREAASHVDCVVIATPPHTDRVMQLATVLNAGVKRVRIEKPMAMSWEDARDMKRMADAAGASLSIGHTSVWNGLVYPLSRHVSVLHASKRLQQLDFFRCCERGPAHAVTPVWDLASHDVALHRAICGWAWRSGPPEVVDGGEDKHGTAWFQLEDGATFTVSHTYPFTTRGVTINGTHVYDEQRQTFMFDNTFLQGSLFDPLGAELMAWAKGYVLPGSIGIDVVKVCEQAQSLIAERKIRSVVG